MRRLLSPRRSTGASWASLAPMVDLLTILLVFLLKSWSTDPPVRPDDPSFDLPVSVGEQPLPPLRAVDLTERGIFLDGRRVAGTRLYRDGDEELIQELYQELLAAPGPVQVRADADQPYVLVRRALFTAQEAGVSQITLVAVSSSSL